jgi:hypothetical protein
MNFGPFIAQIMMDPFILEQEFKALNPFFWGNLKIIYASELVP